MLFLLLFTLDIVDDVTSSVMLTQFDSLLCLFPNLNVCLIFIFLPVVHLVPSVYLTLIALITCRRKFSGTTRMSCQSICSPSNKRWDNCSEKDLKVRKWGLPPKEKVTKEVRSCLSLSLLYNRILDDDNCPRFLDSLFSTSIHFHFWWQ